MKKRILILLIFSVTILYFFVFLNGYFNKNENKPSNNTEFILNRTFQKDEDSMILPDGKTLEERILLPDGYKRSDTIKGSFAQFIRRYKMKEDKSPVLLYDGSEKRNRSAHIAVFSLPIEKYDLQQCADSIMRMYAEYFWYTKQFDKISFYFTNGFLCEYTKWRKGYRVHVDGNVVTWRKDTDYDDSYETFLKYLKVVFSYSGTLSMEKYETEIISVDKIEVGDIILNGDSPGHVVMIVDVCENEMGEKAYLMGQGYMPAQEFHVIKNPKHENDPWYYENEMTFPLRTAEYTFTEENMIRRLKY